MNNRVGQQIGNYRLSRLLGQGGFAEVYLGEHIYLKTPVALKFLYGKLTEQDVRDFMQEAQMLARLKHPHIVRISDFGIEQRTPYIVMDYAPHGTLRDRHPRGTLVPLSQILEYMRQVGSALDYTHKHKLIHRDIKPANMLLDEHYQIQLSDFGIASIAHRTASRQLQTISGTARYMAPEQFRGYPTPASDQYSLGIIVYEWLCGECPFQGADFIEVGMKHASAPVPSLRQKNPGILPDIEQVVLQALAKDQKQRFPAVQAFVQALDLAINGTGSKRAVVRYTQPAMTTVRPVALIGPAKPVQLEELRHWMDEGNHYYHAGRFLEALAAYEQALRLDPGNSNAYYHLGNTFFSLQRYEEALRAYERAIRLDPDHAYAYTGKELALFRLQRYEEVVSTYEQMIRLDPDNAHAYNNKGVALEQLQRHEEALRAYEQALRLDPNNAYAYHNKRDVLKKLGRPDDVN